MDKSKEELKQEEAPSGDIQPEKKESDKPKKGDTPEKTKEEILVEENAKLKEESEKTKEENVRLIADNVNYKQKIKNDTISDFTLEEEEEKETPSVEVPKTEIDEKAWDEVDRRAREIAKETFVGQSKKEILANEKTAKKLFFAENQEVLANTAMQAGIKEYYINRHGKTPEGIKIDMQDALNLYKINNNIAIEGKSEEDKSEENKSVDIPSMPTGGGQSPPEAKNQLSEKDKEIKSSYCNFSGQELSDEAFLSYKQAVLNGRGAPQEVVNLFNQSV